MIRKISLFAAAGVLSLSANAFAVDPPAAAAPAPEGDKVDFVVQILPILEERCMKCHREPYEDDRGRMKKPKGALRLDTPEDILKGGESVEDGEQSIVPGKPDESLSIKLMMLPEDDDDVMPPEGKADHLTEAEVELFKKWITEGAEFGDWKGTKFNAEGEKVE